MRLPEDTLGRSWSCTCSAPAIREVPSDRTQEGRTVLPSPPGEASLGSLPSDPPKVAAGTLTNPGPLGPQAWFRQDRTDLGTRSSGGCKDCCTSRLSPPQWRAVFGEGVARAVLLRP